MSDTASLFVATSALRLHGTAACCHGGGRYWRALLQRIIQCDRRRIGSSASCLMSWKECGGRRGMCGARMVACTGPKYK